MEQGANTNPELAAVIRAVPPAALRANYTAFLDEPGVHAQLAGSSVPMLMYAGTADVWHDPMRQFAEHTGTPFLSLPDADHLAGWHRAHDMLPEIQRFLDAEPG
ncbi:hypothetical protein QRX50_23295 [Amycolatopsis carbonis]|uniref:Alpha/beta hydrolase n=1 Tax=Amycolatopsis carbonis TaxID=715471 RepID=A0A9Y2N1Y5_9PSEU|nr:hypothetical protein [Amycolatopsis sp. 2-15]WIX83472.1 hypothetical protein QRX50_23295 [Amycolatopsis sp. 2-15]